MTSIGMKIVQGGALTTGPRVQGTPYAVVTIDGKPVSFIEEATFTMTLGRQQVTLKRFNPDTKQQYEEVYDLTEGEAEFEIND